MFKAFKVLSKFDSWRLQVHTFQREAEYSQQLLPKTQTFKHASQYHRCVISSSVMCEDGEVRDEEGQGQENFEDILHVGSLSAK